MEEQTFLDRMISRLRSSCKYHTGYPKDLGPSRVTHFTSEREFVQLLHEGRPVAVCFTIRGNYTQHLDQVLEEAAAEFYPHVKFVRVECPKYPGFCITRQKNEYPFVEIFHSPEQAGSQGLLIQASQNTRLKFYLSTMISVHMDSENFSSAIRYNIQMQDKAPSRNDLIAFIF